MCCLCVVRFLLAHHLLLLLEGSPPNPVVDWSRHLSWFVCSVFMLVVVVVVIIIIVIIIVVFIIIVVVVMVVD